MDFWTKMLTARMRFVHFAEPNPEKKPEDGGAGGEDNPEDKTPEGGKVSFTPEQQAEMEKILKGRLARQKTTLETEAKTKEERAKLDTEERLKVEKADALKAKEEAEQREKVANWRADLSPFVVDSRKAIKLLDEEAHINEDGSVNVKAFLKDNPFLKKGAEVEDDGDENPEDRPRPKEKPASTGPGTGGPQNRDAKAPGSLEEARAQDQKARQKR